MEPAAQVDRVYLGALLVERDVVTAEELEDALAEQAETGVRLGEILIRRGVATRVAITEALAAQAGLPLEPERGFGSGLRDQLELRHREKRGQSVGIHAVEAPADAEPETPALEEPTPLQAQGDIVDELLAQLGAAREENDALVAELAAARSTLAERSAEPSPLGPDTGVDGHLARAAAHLTARRAGLPPLLRT